MVGTILVNQAIKTEDNTMSLRDKVLAVVGATQEAELKKMAEKAEKKGTVAVTREPKMPRSKSGEFMNIRHMGEAVLINVPEITPRAFAEMIGSEFPDSQASLGNWSKNETQGHYPYYRRYVLTDDIKFGKQIAEQAEKDGVDYATLLGNAKIELAKTITRKTKTKE